MNGSATMKISESSVVDIRTGALLRITSAIETATTLDELLLLSLNEFVQLLNVPLGGIALLSDDGTRMQPASVYPPRVTLPPDILISEMRYLPHVIHDRQPAQIYDLEVEASSPEIYHWLSDANVRSMLLVPLVAQDQVAGVLALATTATPRHFGDNEIALTRVMAGQLAAAITSFRLTEAAQRRTSELATMNEIAATVTSSLDPREIYHLVVRQINEYFCVDAGSLLMRDDETGELEFVMTLEAGEEKLAGVRVPPGQGVAGHVADTQRHAIVLDVQNDPRFYRKVSEDVGYVTRSILCVPMVVKGRTIGVIELLNKQNGDFTEEDAERLIRMAATIGVALENARLFQQVTDGRDRLEAILNSTTDGILMADIYGTVVTANPMAVHLLQMRKEAIIGQQLTELLTQLRTRALNISVPSWLNGDAQTSDVVELEFGGAQHRFIRHLALPVRDTRGVEIGQLALFHDVSNERELAQLRDDYTGMLVHDLRAPLTSIMNGIMMVKRGLGGPITDQQQELLAIAHQGSQTMLEMVNTLLDISRLEQGRPTLNPEPLSPYALVDETLDRLRPSAEGQNVGLQQQLAVGLPLLEADRGKLIRVLQNLLDNAIKFSPSGSEITLGSVHMQTDGDGAPTVQSRGVTPPVTPPLLAEGEWLLLWVRDQGPGIPAQYHERIFEKFGQVRGRKVRGTGLGLTFCKLAVEAHGGQIWLESAEGMGSTFALALPLNNYQEQFEA
jgi:two-component system, NtrC family, sensor histidine kinase KinB